MIEDAKTDPRFSANPLVTGDPRIRFYAGVPLTSEAGFNLGSLCVIDTKPRTLDPQQQTLLADLAALTCRELEMHKAASTDGLTEVFNRSGLLAQGPRELARARRAQLPLSVAVIDLDNLKIINDTLGHAGGDVALRCVADLAGTELREGDIVGRLGGDEFALILPDATSEVAYSLAQQLRSAIREQKIFPPGHDLTLAVSIGVAAVAEDEADLEAAWKRADAALYSAKSQGNSVVVAD